MLGNNLKIIRKSKGLSQEYVANQLHISRQSLSNWENEKACPDIQHLLALSNLYEVSLDKLVGNTTFSSEVENAQKYNKELILVISLLAILVMSTLISFIGLIVSSVIFIKIFKKDYPFIISITCILCFLISLYNFALFIFNTFLNYGVSTIR